MMFDTRFRDTPHNQAIIHRAFVYYQAMDARGWPDEMGLNETPINRFRSCLAEAGWLWNNRDRREIQGENGGMADFLAPDEVLEDVKMRFIQGDYRSDIDYTVDFPVKRVKPEFRGRYIGCLVTHTRLLYPGYLNWDELKSFPVRKAGTPLHGGQGVLQADCYTVLRSQFRHA